MSSYSIGSSSSTSLTRSNSPADFPKNKTDLTLLKIIAHLPKQGTSLTPESHLTAGTMSWIYQDYTRAIEHFEKGIAFLHKNSDHSLNDHSIYVYHERTADSYLELKKYAKAASHFEASLDKMTSSDEAAAQRHIMAAKCYLAINDYAQGALHFKSALKFYHALTPKQNKKSSINLSQLRIDTAHACMRAQDYTTATALFETTIQTLRRKKRRIPISILSSTAQAYHFDGQKEKAIAYFDRYTKQCRKQGLPVPATQETFFASIT